MSADEPPLLTARLRAQLLSVWAMRTGVVTLEPLRRLRRAEATALEADASDVVRYLAASASN